MPASSIPKEYGGSCTSCSGETCLDYTKGGSFLSSKATPFTTVHVPNRTEHDVPVGPVVEGDTLEWSFICHADDIEAFVVDKGDGSIVHTIGRVTSHQGRLELDGSRELVFRYSNEFS